MTLVERLREMASVRTSALFSQRKLINEAADRIEALEAELEKAREALEPFALMIERSDGMDLEYLSNNAPGIEIEVYTPSTDKLVSSGEMRNAVYVTRGDFRRAREVFRALSHKEG